MSMPHDHTYPASAIVLRWRGPFSFDEACKRSTVGGLYCVTGRYAQGANPAKSKLLYIGKSNDRPGGVGARIKEHASREFNHGANQWWIAWVRYPTFPLSQRLSPWEATALGIAESALIGLYTPEVNVQGQSIVPNHDVYLLHEWFRSDGSTRWSSTEIAEKAFAAPRLLGSGTMFWAEEGRWHTLVMG